MAVAPRVIDVLEVEEFAVSATFVHVVGSAHFFSFLLTIKAIVDIITMQIMLTMSKMVWSVIPAPFCFRFLHKGMPARPFSHGV